MDGMELAKTLVRSVVRSFYETRHVLVVDVLVQHSCLRDDDLAYLMGMNTKELHKLCGHLREERLLAVHTRAEQREGQLRPNNRTYYYIDYRQSTDAIKWRVFKLSKQVQQTPVPTDEKKEYICDNCGSQWAVLDIINNSGARGLRCNKCADYVRHAPTDNVPRHSSRMNDQLRFITDLLLKIDSTTVPDNEFDIAIAKAVPVTRLSTHQVAATTVVDTRPTAVKGRTDAGPKTVQVNISTADGPTDAEAQAEREHREKIAKQNALPSWMSMSTVSGAAYSTNPEDNPTSSTTNVAQPTPEKKDNTEAIDDVFAKLKAAREAEEEEEDDDEDDMEFEDVTIREPPKKDLGGGESDDDLEFEDVS